MQGSYYCTFQAISIDFDKSIKRHVIIELCIFLQMLQWLLVVFTIVQVITHYRMLIRWLTENPVDGQAFARAIQVGSPPEVDTHSANNISNIVAVGLQVPEADREVKRDPTAF